MLDAIDIALGKFVGWLGAVLEYIGHFLIVIIASACFLTMVGIAGFWFSLAFGSGGFK